MIIFHWNMKFHLNNFCLGTGSFLKNRKYSSEQWVILSIEHSEEQSIFKDQQVFQSWHEIASFLRTVSFLGNRKFSEEQRIFWGTAHFLRNSTFSEEQHIFWRTTYFLRNSMFSEEQHIFWGKAHFLRNRAVLEEQQFQRNSKLSEELS